MIIEIPNGIWKQMTKEEQQEELINSFCGMRIPQQNIIAMGFKAIKRLEDFRTEMINKYSKPLNL